MSELPLLGAPGVYFKPRRPLAALTNVALDVCAFVGVAPRGPAYEPAWDVLRDLAALAWNDPARPRQRSVARAVDSWDEYVNLYGAFEGPGLLPYAVASFFEQGGRRAYIVRVVHRTTLENEGVASGRLRGMRRRDGSPGELRLWAKNRGAWGNRLRVTLRCERRYLATVKEDRRSRAALTDIAPVGTLEFGSSDGRRLDAAARSQGSQSRKSLAVLEANLVVVDGDGRTERFSGLGFEPSHPRWLARVLADESALVQPDSSWCNAALEPLEAELRDSEIVSRFDEAETGKDLYGSIDERDFLEDHAHLDPEQQVGDGVRAVLAATEIGLLVAPDLYSLPLPPRSQPLRLPRAEFELCRPQVTSLPEPEGLNGLQLDPRRDLDVIIGRQSQLLMLAAEAQSFVALIDVPPDLTPPQVERWRAAFKEPALLDEVAAQRLPPPLAPSALRALGSFGAAYHPWIFVDRGDDGRSRVRIPPSAVAAGIVARCELTLGLPHGPANELARFALDVAEQVSPAVHARLHQSGINVFARERDGIRLTGARTLTSAAVEYRQLSVRRLMIMIRRALLEQMQWAAFEPNDDVLRQRVTRLIESWLRQLHRLNTFAGEREEEAFFVRCDAELNPPQQVRLGNLVCRIGVAPAEPLEFILVSMQRDGDGTLRLTG